MKLLEQLMGASIATGIISGYFAHQNGAVLAGATLFASGVVTGAYLAEFAAKSDRTSYGEESQ